MEKWLKDKILKHLKKQPIQRLTILANTDLGTGETRGVIVKQTGDAPPISEKLSDKNEGKVK